MSGSSMFVALTLALTQSVDGARVMRSDDISPFASAETTVRGCSCTNQCGATVGSYYKCDWCNVPSSCAGKRWSLTRGNYDFCAFDKVDAYEAQSHSKKLSTLWNLIMATKGKSREMPSTAALLLTLLQESVRTTFDGHRDVVPAGRSKNGHIQGVVCQFEIDVSSSSPYTGLLSPGKSVGLVRMSSAVPAPGVFPGVSVKFLRTGVLSGNVVAIRKAGLNAEGNFFDNDLSNHVPPPDVVAALQKLQQASACMSKLGLSELCRYDQNGGGSSSLKFPYELLFEGHSETAPYNSAVPDGEVLRELEKIPAGVGLYNVYAKASPTESKKLLGTMRTITACTRSLFGDEQLFFEHVRMEADLALRPEWIKDAVEPLCDASGRDVSEWQCTAN